MENTFIKKKTKTKLIGSKKSENSIYSTFSYQPPTLSLTCRARSVWQISHKNLLKIQCWKKTNLIIWKNQNQPPTVYSVYKTRSAQKLSYKNFLRHSSATSYSSQKMFFFSGKGHSVTLEFDWKNSSSSPNFCNMWYLMCENTCALPDLKTHLFLREKCAL